MFCLLRPTSENRRSWVSVVNKLNEEELHFISEYKKFLVLDTSDGKVDIFDIKGFTELVALVEVHGVHDTNFVIKFTKIRELFDNRMELCHGALFYNGVRIFDIKDSTQTASGNFIIDFHYLDGKIIESVRQYFILNDFYIVDIEWIGDIFVVTFAIESTVDSTGFSNTAILQCVFDKEKMLGVYSWDAQFSFKNHVREDYDIFVQDKSIRARLGLIQLRIKKKPYVFSRGS